MSKIKKLVASKEREERKCNIAVKGLCVVDDMRQNKLTVEKLIRDKLEIDCGIISCRRSGVVLVAKVESEGKKKEIIQNKYILKSETIFIENDLSWEERKIQERMNRWAKDQREKGKDIRIGFGRVKIDGMWKSWTEISQREEQERERIGKEKEKKKEKEVGGGIGKEKKQNFE